ncbi:hypothetical protein MA05_04820 [Comamonas aquatica]|nr:hypothetical protein MA05_04820 [Comamonas aquatica]
MLSNENNPSVIYSTAKQYGITTQMLTEVVSAAIPSIDLNGVRQFFKNSGLDSLQLDNSSAHLDPNYFKNLFDASKLVAYQGINDNINLGDGDDYVDAGPGDDTVKGNGGNDVLLGGSGNDNIDGGRGADYIEGGFGADKLYGGKYANSTYVYGYYQGNQWIYGYDVYTVDYSTNLIYGGGGDDYIEGGYGADVLDGGDGADTIYGGGKSSYDGSNIRDHDIIYGRGGDDRIYGEEGDDVIYGGTGDDYIRGASGSDTIYGEEGDDTIFAQNDSYSDDYTVDYVFGGAGNDTIYIASGDQAHAGEGNDTITFRAGSSTAQAVTTALIVAGEGADRINAYELSESSRLIIDLNESTQTTDKIDGWSINDSTFNMTMEVRGFNIKYDIFSIGSFDLNGYNGTGYNGKYDNANYSQILTSASTPYLQRNIDYNNPDPDAYGKGFFVIQGASATASDSLSAATFIDAYGNNAAYDKEDVHYFLINVGTSDMGLYRFKDDSGADNNVVADELTPVALFVGLRTENFTTQDLFNVFTYS